MKKNFGFDAFENKLKLSAQAPWTVFERGEGELEVESQGRLRISSFAQETVAIGQQAPRIGDDRPKLRSTQRVFSAGRTGFSSSTSHFLFRDFSRISSLVLRGTTDGC
jgi:hypothetical protein